MNPRPATDPADTLSPPATIEVDLDRTLVWSDALHETALGALRREPLKMFSLPWLMWRSRERLRTALRGQPGPDASLLPYNRPLVEWLRTQRAAGSRIVLRTAGDLRMARAVADHLKLPDAQVSDAVEGAGDRAPDDGIGRAAPATTGDRASGAVDFPRPPPTPADWRRLLRVHQWLKNLLLAVPLLAAHQVDDPWALGMLLAAFIAFSLCASAGYVVNDLLDLESDRRHPRKRQRPFAAGVLPVKSGVALAPALAALGLAVGSLAGPVFMTALVGYLAASLLYSSWLKRHAVVDCLTLASLYTLRVIAGAAAVAIFPSFWLIVFSGFMFLSLAFMKRYAELQALAAAGRRDTPGRGYAVADAPLVLALGIAAGQTAVLVLALYLQGDTVAALYRTPEIIWSAVPLLLFWVNWAWLKAHRGEMHDDPVVFAVNDPASRTVAVLLLATFLLASTGLGG